MHGEKKNTKIMHFHHKNLTLFNQTDDTIATNSRENNNEHPNIRDVWWKNLLITALSTGMFWLHGIVNSHIICGVCTTITYVHSPNCVNDSDHMLYKQLYTLHMHPWIMHRFSLSHPLTSSEHRPSLPKNMVPCARVFWLRALYCLCLLFLYKKKLYIWNTTTKKETNVVCFWTVLTTTSTKIHIYVFAPSEKILFARLKIIWRILVGWWLRVYCIWLTEWMNKSTGISWK